MTRIAGRFSLEKIAVVVVENRFEELTGRGGTR